MIIFLHNNLQKNLILLKNLTFRQIEFVLKENCNFLVACEGGITHLSTLVLILLLLFKE